MTAIGAAKRRAAHQILDDPIVFEDPLAIRILNADYSLALCQYGAWFEQTPLSRGIRAALVARSRYTEDELHAAVKRGISQYVILGAGLDTFAYRNPYPVDALHVYEVDHPATQMWKRSRLEKAGIPIPDTLSFCPVNFEIQTLGDGLQQAGFDTGKSSFFSWLGVVIYLTNSAITSTLQFVASLPTGSTIVFDYMIFPSMLNPVERLGHEFLAYWVSLAGEPFQTFFNPLSLENNLRAMGFGQIENLAPEEIQARYFEGRKDNLRIDGMHLINAQV